MDAKDLKLRDPQYVRGYVAGVRRILTVLQTQIDAQKDRDFAWDDETARSDRNSRLAQLTEIVDAIGKDQPWNVK